MYLLIWDICLEYEYFGVQCNIFPVQFNKMIKQSLHFKSLTNNLLSKINGPIDYFTFGGSISESLQAVPLLSAKILDMSMNSLKFTDSMFYLDEETAGGTAPILPKYEYVACGGTFDNFHYGHKILLTMALAICTKALVIGISSPTLLANKKNVDQIQPLDVRRKHVTSFLDAVIESSDVSVESSADSEVLTFSRQTDGEFFNYQVLMPTLFDGFGPTITDPRIQAIIVSSETINGALKANIIREGKGFPPLFIYVVKRNNTATLSSTFLRRYASTQLQASALSDNSSK